MIINTNDIKIKKAIYRKSIYSSEIFLETYGFMSLEEAEKVENKINIFNAFFIIGIFVFILTNNFTVFTESKMIPFYFLCGVALIKLINILFKLLAFYIVKAKMKKTGNINELLHIRHYLLYDLWVASDKAHNFYFEDSKTQEI